MTKPKQKRGFAGMDPDKRRAIAAIGGHAVPAAKRQFSQDRELAARAGRVGGKGVPDDKRSFSQDRELAAASGRKGGLAKGVASRRRARKAFVHAVAS